MIKTRCAWVNNKNKLYIKYHDEEWGIPVFDDRKLFEMLILEWAQAGLSWETVLNKRKNYKKAFDNFDPKKVEKYDDKKIEKLLVDEGIIRNRLKIKSVIKNAKVFLKIVEEFGSFSKYIWWFVDNKPIKNIFKNNSVIPIKTPLSDKISKDLKNRWMSFVWSTIIYAFMQAVWIVYDHENNCFKKC